MAVKVVGSDIKDSGDMRFKADSAFELEGAYFGTDIAVFIKLSHLTGIGCTDIADNGGIIFFSQKKSGKCSCCCLTVSTGYGTNRTRRDSISELNLGDNRDIIFLCLHDKREVKGNTGA